MHRANCGAWNGDDHRRRCTRCGATLESVPDYLVRDSYGVALRVGRSNLRLALHADQPLAAGDYSGARRYSRLVRQRAHAAFWFTVAALLFFGIIYALDALSNPYVTVQPEVLQAVCYPRSSRERVCFSLRFGAPLVARRGRCC